MPAAANLRACQVSMKKPRVSVNARGSISTTSLRRVGMNFIRKNPRMKFMPTRLSDVVLIEPRAFTDTRGFFMETWQALKFAAAGIDGHFVQDNQSVSRQWVLRGLHYQLYKPQG